MKSKLFVNFFFCSLLLSTQAIAGDGHNHEPAVEDAPNGGMLRDAPPFKSEIVLNKDNVKLYIYKKIDKKLKLIKYDQKSLSGYIQFPRKKEKKPVEFKLKGDYYEATIKGISKTHRFDMHVTLKNGKENATVDFGVDNLKI
jgi:hypothetical protein